MDFSKINIPNELLIAGVGILLILTILLFYGIRKGIVTVLSIFGVEIDLQKLLGGVRGKKDTNFKEILIELDEWKRLHNVVQDVLEKIIDLGGTINLLKSTTVKNRSASEFIYDLQTRWQRCESQIISASSDFDTYKVINNEVAVAHFCEEISRLRKLMTAELFRLSDVKDMLPINQVYTVNWSMLNQCIGVMKLADRRILALINRAKQEMKIPV